MRKVSYYDNVIFIIEGHTDARWDDTFNKRLSEIRAQQAKDFLIEKGIDKELIETVGYGSSNPRPSDGSFYDEKDNNRLVIRLKKRLAKKVVGLKYKIKDSKRIKSEELTPDTD